MNEIPQKFNSMDQMNQVFNPNQQTIPPAQQQFPQAVNIPVSTPKINPEPAPSSEIQIFPLTTVNSIIFTDSFCSAVVRLPQNLLKSKSDCVELLSYREFNHIVSTLGMKNMKNRTKQEMLNAIIFRTGSLWPEIHSRCQQLIKIIDPPPEAPKKESKSKKAQNQIQIPRQPRTPFDPRLAQILSDLYMSPTESWNDFLVTSNPDETKSLIDAIKSIRSEEVELSNTTFPTDSFILQYISGQSRITNSYLNQFKADAEDLNNIVYNLTRNDQPDQSANVRNKVKI